MPRSTQPNWSPRQGFEEYEERIVFSAQPVDDLPPLVACGLPDLVLHDELLDTGDLDPATVTGAANAWNPHAGTGLDYVRDTYGFTGSGQTVAIIDSGIAWDHYALGGGLGDGYRVVGGWDFAENDADPYDDGPFGFHGTHVAGIVGSDNATYRGVAPGVDLVALRVFDDQGSGYFSWVEQALQWVHTHRNSFENPITTVNLSIGTAWNANSVPQWATLEDEFAQLKADGIVVTVSAGNSFAQYNAKGVSYPAASPHVIPVASVGPSGNLSSFSQRNDRVLAAPGENLMSTVPDRVYSYDNVPDDFAIASGTSMASPYVAGASVLVRQAMEAAGRSDINPDTIYATLRDSADPVYDSITRTTYFRINVGAAIDAVMQGQEAGAGGASGGAGDSDDDGGFALAGNWGTVAADRFVSQHLAGEAWFQVTASQAGLFSVLADGGAAGLELSLHAPDQQPWAASTSGDDGRARVDVTAAAGQVFLVRVAGDAAEVDFTVANLVARSGQTVTVSGTSGDDSFAYRNAATHLVEAGGLEYSFAKNAVAAIRFDGGAGHDTLQLTGSAAAEQSALRVGSVLLTNRSYSVAGFAMETVRVDGGGGADAVALYDSAGDDTFSGGGGSAELTGVGFEHRVENFATITAYASGGLDAAQLSDTAGDDVLVIKPSVASLRGGGYAITLNAFERVAATATAGRDVATLFGTTGADTVTGSRDVVTLRSGNLWEEARGFDAVTVEGGAGVDAATLTGSDGSDTFKAAPGSATLTGPGYVIALRNVEAIAADGQAGNDIALLAGSRAADLFTAGPAAATLVSGGASFTASGFEQVTAVAGARGADRAILFDSAGDDALVARPLDVSLSGAGYSITAKGFAQVEAVGTTGHDRATFYDSRRNDIFTSRPGEASMVGPGFHNRATGFDAALGISSSGLDLARLYDSPAADTLTSLLGRTSISSPGYEATAEKFRQVRVYGDGGGANSAVFAALGARESLAGRDNWISALRGPAKLIAYDFDFVAFDSQPGVAVRADVQAVDYLFEREG